MPAWVGFDHLVDPADAARFLQARLLASVFVVGCFSCLFTRLGSRRPAVFVFSAITVTNVMVAYMIVHAGPAAGVYAMGMALLILLCALMVWASGWIFAVVGAAWLSVGAASLLAAHPPAARALGVVAFVVVTASVVAVAGQLLRERAGRREFESRYHLTLERERNHQLLADLERLSREDPLTGLGNRRHWQQALLGATQQERPDGIGCAVVLCDLDGLKVVNDTYGHLLGDRVIQAAAAALAAAVRRGDLVARLGGDEFGVLCVDTNSVTAADLAERLRQAICEMAVPGVPRGTVTASIGAATHRPDDTAEELVHRADSRLYIAKRRRNTVVTRDGPTTAIDGPVTLLLEQAG